MICPRCHESTLPDHGLLLNETCCWRCVGIDELVNEISAIRLENSALRAKLADVEKILTRNKGVPYRGFLGEPPCWHCVLDTKCKPENPCQAFKDLIEIRKATDNEARTVELNALNSKLADIPKIKKKEFNEDAVPKPSTEKTDTRKRQKLVEKNCENCGNSDHDEIGRIFCSIRSGMICYQREDRNKLLSPFVMTNWKLKDAAPEPSLPDDHEGAFIESDDATPDNGDENE